MGPTRHGTPPPPPPPPAPAPRAPPRRAYITHTTHRHTHTVFSLLPERFSVLASLNLNYDAPPASVVYPQVHTGGFEQR